MNGPESGISAVRWTLCVAVVGGAVGGWLALALSGGGSAESAGGVAMERRIVAESWLRENGLPVTRPTIDAIAARIRVRSAEFRSELYGEWVLAVIERARSLPSQGERRNPPAQVNRAPAPPARAGGPLELYDDDANGRIACAEARRHRIAPVTRQHPAYPYMRDPDGDGVVCR